jgi:hypothetical protein
MVFRLWMKHINQVNMQGTRADEGKIEIDKTLDTEWTESSSNNPLKCVGHSWIKSTCTLNKLGELGERMNRILYGCVKILNWNRHSSNACTARGNIVKIVWKHRSVYSPISLCWPICMAVQESCSFRLMNNDKCARLINLSVRSCPATRQAGAKAKRKYSSYSFLISALDRGEWSASRPCHVSPPGKDPPDTHRIGGWVGHKVALDTEATGKILCLCRGSNSGLQDNSQTLYQGYIQRG